MSKIPAQKTILAVIIADAVISTIVLAAQRSGFSEGSVNSLPIPVFEDGEAF